MSLLAKHSRELPYNAKHLIPIFHSRCRTLILYLYKFLVYFPIPDSVSSLIRNSSASSTAMFFYANGTSPSLIIFPSLSSSSTSQLDVSNIIPHL